MIIIELFEVKPLIMSLALLRVSWWEIAHHHEKVLRKSISTGSYCINFFYFHEYNCCDTTRDNNIIKGINVSANSKKKKKNGHTTREHIFTVYKITHCRSLDATRIIVSTLLVRPFVLGKFIIYYIRIRGHLITFLKED